MLLFYCVSLLLCVCYCHGFIKSIQINKLSVQFTDAPSSFIRRNILHSEIISNRPLISLRAKQPAVTANNANTNQEEKKEDSSTIPKTKKVRKNPVKKDTSNDGSRRNDNNNNEGSDISNAIVTNDDTITITDGKLMGVSDDLYTQKLINSDTNIPNNDINKNNNIKINRNNIKINNKNDLDDKKDYENTKAVNHNKASFNGTYNNYNTNKNGIGYFTQDKYMIMLEECIENNDKEFSYVLKALANLGLNVKIPDGNIPQRLIGLINKLDLNSLDSRTFSELVWCLGKLNFGLNNYDQKSLLYKLLDRFCELKEMSSREVTTSLVRSTTY